MFRQHSQTRYKQVTNLNTLGEWLFELEFHNELKLSKLVAIFYPN